jgi:hypothetical protein
VSLDPDRVEAHLAGRHKDNARERDSDAEPDALLSAIKSSSFHLDIGAFQVTERRRSVHASGGEPVCVLRASSRNGLQNCNLRVMLASFRASTLGPLSQLCHCSLTVHKLPFPEATSRRIPVA